MMRLFLILLQIFLLYIQVINGDGFVTKYTNLINVNGRIACLGDFNSDRATDVFIIRKDATYLDVYAWNGDDYIKISTLQEDHPIQYAAASDFNLDGSLDVIVWGNNFMNVHLGHLTSFGQRIQLYVSNAPPTLLDYNGDRRVDLLGTYNSQLYVWENIETTNFGVNFTLVSTDFLPQNDFPELEEPTYGWVDMDGDCQADFVRTYKDNNDLKYIQILTTQWNFKYQNKYTKKLPNINGQLSFSDFNGDGTIDILMPVSNADNTNGLHIYYNYQRSMCSSRFKSSSSCRSQWDLCQSDSYFKFPTNWETIDNNGAGHVELKFETGWTYYKSSVSPITIRVGDADLDGFPDLLIVLEYDSKPILTYWSNIPCNSKLCTHESIQRGDRTFEKQNFPSLNNLNNVYAATFLDIGRGGSLDILVLHYDDDNKKYYTTALSNVFYPDAYFISTEGLNGVCPAWCSGDNAPRGKFPSPKPYGVNHPGVSVKFTVTDLGGTNHPRQGVQLPQSAYLPLSTPYSFFGLGRTNNYVEEFFVGVPLKQTNHWNNWVALIPNSQLICFPYKPEHPSTWILELFVNPSASLLVVSMTLLVILVINGAYIIYLYLKERKEDQLDQQTETLFVF